MSKKLNDPLLQPPSAVDVLYLLGIFFSFIAFNFIACGVGYLVFVVIFCSIYQDWISARVAELREHWYFLFSDLLTVFNYISLFISLTLPSNPKLGYNERIWLHWGVIFLIYIIWNFVMLKISDTDRETRKFFFKFSMIEAPIAIFCFVIFFEIRFSFIFNATANDILRYPDFLLFVMAFVHISILAYWNLETYLTSK